MKDSWGKDIDEELEEGAKEVRDNREMFEKDSVGVSIGFEEEYLIFDSDGELDDGTLQQEIKKEFDYADSEVGQPMLELDIGPMHIEDLYDAEEEIVSKEREIQEFLGEDGDLVRIGANPIQTPDEFEINEAENAPDRYRGLIEKFEGMREQGSFGDGVQASGRMPCGIMGTQLNWQPKGIKDGIEKHNLLYQIGRSVAALSGNSRIVGGEDSGLESSRLPGWMAGFNPQSDDRESKVGPIEKYPENLKDLLEQRHLDHEEAEDPFEAAQAEDWKFTRAKLERPDEEEEPENPENYQMIIESRVPGIQPTAAEDVALAAFQIGWVHYAQNNDSDDIEIEEVNQDYENAFRYGLDAELYSREGERKDAEYVIGKQIQQAREGLRDLGIDEKFYLDILEMRLKESRTPNDDYQETVQEYEEQGMDREDALVEAAPEAGQRYRFGA